MRRFVITGGLGAGKTSLVSALGDEVERVSEPARELIAEHRVTTGERTLDGRPDLFVERLIERSLEKYRSVPEGATAVFDRGLPDCVAYAALYGVDTHRAVEAATLYRYESLVFVAPPWKAIYTTDEMRRATFSQAEAFYSEVVSAYDDLGYEMVELPKSSIETRAAFIASRFSQHDRS